MSHINPGLISAYNSLTDKHLAGYFSNTRIRRHLHRAGLITRSGRIVPDKEYRHKLIQRAQQRHVRECLAQAIFHKVLEMERVHQIEIKRKLEEFARRERLHKIKAERSKRYEEDTICIMSPRPPMGAKDIRKQHSGPEGEQTESSESPGSSRPNTAPGKMQRPVRLKPIHSNSTTASLRRSSPYRLLESCNDQHFSCSMEKESRRRLTRMEASRDISPYCLPVINNFVTPVPPATKRKERGAKVTPSCTLRGRRLRPTTASSGPDVNEEPPWLRSSVHQSKVSVTMIYFGKSVHLSHDLTDMRDEVKVFQQHCGGENLCVYKGLLREGETFRLVSRRHRGFPFSLTFFLNGLQVERLSSCCEFKHRKGSRLGGRHGHFGFISVEGASPCYKCIIAVGLDKKPTPPPKRVKGDEGREGSSVSPKDAPELKRMTEDAASPSECDTNQNMESPLREDTPAEEDKVRDEYEEDFEADDEGPAEEEKEKRALSPSSEAQSQTKDASGAETEDDEKDDDVKCRSRSSSSGSDREESDGEAEKEGKKAEQPKEVSREEEAVPPPDETSEPDPEEAAIAEAEPAAAPESDLQNSAAESTEIDISDSTVPSENDNKQSDDTSGDKDVEKTVDENKPEEEQERAKSVQEKMAEAILKESHCSSEPELSNTSTEEEEEPMGKGHEQHSKDAGPESSVTHTEQQQTFTEEMKSEDGAAAEAAEAAEVMVQGPDPEEQKEEPEQESHQNSDSTKAEEDAPEETTAEKDKSEDAEDTDVLLASGEEINDKTSEPPEDLADKSNNTDENKEQPATVADVQQEETGQGAKSSEENESEPNKTTDETGVADNVEAEATTGSETMEMKAEPSEEQEEALDCEEAPVGETERSQQGGSPDREAERQVTAETSGSSVERSGDAAGEETAGTSEMNPKDESNGDGVKEEGAQEVSVARGEMDEQERCDPGEEQTEKPEETHDKVEEKPEEKSKTSSDEIVEGEQSGEGHRDDEDKMETDEKREESVAAESTKEDTEGNTKEAEETQHEEEEEKEEEEATAGENVDEVEKTENDEESECVEKNEHCEEEKGAATAEGKEDEKVSEAADGEEEDEAEKQEKDQTDECEAEQSEAVEDEEETKEEKVTTSETLEGEETSENTVKPESEVQADSDRENVNISDGNEDICSSGEAKMAPNTGATDETLNKLEAEDQKREAEGGSKNAENGEVDAENGEVSSAAEKNAHREEASSEGEQDAKPEQNQDEMKTEEPKEDVEEEVTAEAGDGVAEKHEEDQVDQTQNESQEGGTSVEKQDECAEMTSEPETPGGEVKEESEEARKQDENASLSEQDSNRIKLDDHVQKASSGDGELSSAPAAVDLEDSSHNVDELDAQESDYKTEQTPQTTENVAAGEHPATDGENGDTEEASKTSEEGASVLLKPQDQSSPLPQNNEAEPAEVSTAARKETPETLEREDNADLVKNWVTMHQKSKFFETFVEPLEDLKESDAQDEEVTELQRSESPLKSVEAEQGQRSNANETNVEAEEEAEEFKSHHSEDGVLPEKDPVTDTQPVAETEVKDFIPEAASEQNEKESVNVSDVRSEEQRSLEKEEEVQEGLVQDDGEQIDKTEVESFAGTHLSVTSGRAESVTGKKTEEKNAEKQTVVEEAKEEHPEPSSPSNPENVSEYEAKNTEDEKSPEVTQITDLTEFRIQEASNDTEPKASDEGASRDTGDPQLIQDLQHTMSKDRLGSFSVDESWFGPSPYPSTPATRTESGH